MKKATKKANDPSKGSIQNFANRFVDSTKGPIKLRVWARADGNFVLFFDQYIGEGKHKYEFLKNCILYRKVAAMIHRTRHVITRRGNRL